MRTPPFLFLSAIAVLAGCGSSQSNTQPAGPPAHVVPITDIGAGPVPMSPAPPDDAVTLGPPSVHCQPEEPPPPAPSADTAPLAVLATKNGGVALDTSGASAGRVLAAIAAETKHGVDVRGPGSSVRIYAHVKEMPYDAMVKAIATAAGLDLFAPAAEDKSGVLVLQDPRAAREESERQRAVSLATAPLATRLIPAKHAADAARVIAMTLLTCRGRVTAVSGHGLLAVTDVQEVLDHASQLVQTLEAAPPKPVEIETAPPRVAFWGPRAQRCPDVPQTPAPGAANAARLSAEGTAAGDLLARVARAEGRDAIVGCGGDRPAYFSATAAPKSDDVAKALGLVALGGGVFASPDLAPGGAAGQALGGPATQVIQSFAVHDARELANVADDMLGDPSAAVPYEPGSLLVVSATIHDMPKIRELVAAWAQR